MGKFNGGHAVVNDHRIAIHHVGGRSGSISFPIPSSFEEDFINIIYEADDSCIEQIEQSWEGGKVKTMVYPHCLLDKVGRCSFNLNYDPYTSSVYSLNKKYQNYYSHEEGTKMDYVFGDAVRTVKTIELNTTTLDDLLSEGNILAPDFLSLDTQGSELDILKGARNCLQKHILGIALEVEFHPIYKDQPLFGEVCSFLQAYGYDLVDVEFWKRYPIRGKEGFRGEGYVTDGSALFMKSPDLINHDEVIQLNKLGFISLIFNRFENLQLCLTNANYKALKSERRYLQLMAELAEAIKDLPERNFSLFSEVYTLKQSQSRFKSTPKNGKKSLNREILNYASKNKALGFVLQGYRRIKYFCKLLRSLLVSCWQNICLFCLINSGIFRSKVEKILIKYGLKSQFRLVLKNRITDSNI